MTRNVPATKISPGEDTDLSAAEPCERCMIFPPRSPDSGVIDSDLCEERHEKNTPRLCQQQHFPLYQGKPISFRRVRDNNECSPVNHRMILSNNFFGEVCIYFFHIYHHGIVGFSTSQNKLQTTLNQQIGFTRHHSSNNGIISDSSVSMLKCKLCNRKVRVRMEQCRRNIFDTHQHSLI